MANARGYHTVDLDRERKLRLDFNALADAEEKLGMGVGELFSETRMGFSTIRGLYWAGLRWQDKGLTIERTGKILMKCIQEEKTDLEALGKDLTEAMIAGGLMKREAVEELQEDDEEEDGFVENPSEDAEEDAEEKN